MKSVQVMNVIRKVDWENYSDLQVLLSPAGWYVGTIHTDPEQGFKEPGSRDTDYFRTEDEAKYVLYLMEAVEAREDLEDYCIQLDAAIWKSGFDRRATGYRFHP